MLRNEAQRPHQVGHVHLPLNTSLAPAINEQEFKNSMAALTFSIAVVTARNGEEEIGRTVTSFMPLSAVPPRVMISIDVRSRLIDIIGMAKTFSISFLSAQHEVVGDIFAGKGAQSNRFSISFWDVWPSGNHKLVDATVSMDCELTASIDAGDHMLFIGTIIEAEQGVQTQPLLWQNRSYLPLPVTGHDAISQGNE